jgi:hypothetical protein
MGMMKRYLENLIHLCSDQAFGQDAVEWAILSGHVPLTYDLQADLVRIMGPPGFPEMGLYDDLCEAYRRYCAQHEAIDQQLLAA